MGDPPFIETHRNHHLWSFIYAHESDAQKRNQSPPSRSSFLDSDIFRQMWFESRSCSQVGSDSEWSSLVTHPIPKVMQKVATQMDGFPTETNQPGLYDTPRHWWLHQWCVPFQTKATCPRLSGCIIQRHLHLLAGWTPSKISKLPLKPTNTYYKLMKAMGVHTYRTDGLLYSTFACWIPMFINFQRFISRIPSDKNQVVEDSVFFRNSFLHVFSQSELRFPEEPCWMSTFQRNKWNRLDSVL